MTSYLNRLGVPFSTLTSTSAGKYFCSSEPSRKDLSSRSEPSSLRSAPMSKSLVGAAKFLARDPNRYAIFTPYFLKIFGSIFGFTMVMLNISYILIKVNGDTDELMNSKSKTKPIRRVS